MANDDLPDEDSGDVDIISVNNFPVGLNCY